MKERYIKAYNDLVDRTWQPFKDSMPEEEFAKFRYEHTTDEFLNDYEYTYEEEIGYWLDSGDRAYSEYILNVPKEHQNPKIIEELKKLVECNEN